MSGVVNFSQTKANQRKPLTLENYPVYMLIDTLTQCFPQEYNQTEWGGCGLGVVNSYIKAFLHSLVLHVVPSPRDGHISKTYYV